MIDYVVSGYFIHHEGMNDYMDAGGRAMQELLPRTRRKKIVAVY